MLPSLKALVTATALTTLPAITASAATVTFDYTGSIVSWTVPTTAQYVITATGANGGNGNGIGGAVIPGGKGAVMGGTLTLTAGTQLSILVGGTSLTNNLGAGGGGGGTFVVIPHSTNPTPLVIAGGGAGSGFQGIVGGAPSLHYIGTDGSVDLGTNPGFGGLQTTGTATLRSATGAGLLGSGVAGVKHTLASAHSTATGGDSFILGGAGGIGTTNHGGFGGGAGAFRSQARNVVFQPGGAGGGYTGGDAIDFGVARGGYSFLDQAALNPIRISGGNTFTHGHGQVTIAPVIVPEPSTTALLALAALPALRRRR
jgi:hypothetical protein